MPVRHQGQPPHRGEPSTEIADRTACWLAWTARSRISSHPNLSRLAAVQEAQVAALGSFGLLSFEEQRQAVLEGELGDVGHGELLLEGLGHAGQAQFVEQVEGRLAEEAAKEVFGGVGGSGPLYRDLNVITL